MTTRPTIIYTTLVVLVIFVIVYVQERVFNPHMFTSPTLVRVSIPELRRKFVNKLAGTNKSLTIVTGYFNLGTFPKGSMANMRTPKKYEQWLKVFKRIQNPVIFYTDSPAFANTMHLMRNKTKAIRTEIIIIKRDALWSFQILPKIAKLYSSPGYPKHYPNTHIPAYTSMTHSKFPLLLDATTRDYFRTEYYCWLDIGYFREIVSRNKTFWLEVPSKFDSTKVGVTRVFNSTLAGIRPKTIIYGNINWIGGGLFLGKPNILARFAEQYKSAVMRYLNQNLMNVEQQILYAMFTRGERRAHPLDVDVQLYIPGSKKVLSVDPWFFLGYAMYDETYSL